MVEYFEFLDGGVSPYHVVEQSQEELKKLGFIPLNECEEWHLEPGKSILLPETSQASLHLAYRKVLREPIT